MTEIKSALEIALARTRDIQGDKETLKNNELKNDGKKLASSFLDPGSKVDEKEVTTVLKSFSDAERKAFSEGFSGVMLANLTLPSEDTYADKLSLLEKGLQAILKEKKQVAYVFQQVGQFFKQYMKAREQIEAAVKEQYEPKLREKERLLEQQMGAKVHLAHEQDPEYLALLSKNYSRVDAQYNQALLQVKDQLKQLLEAGR